MSCVDTLCAIMNTNTPIVRKLMYQHKGYDTVLNKVKTCKSSKSRTNILNSFARLSSDARFAKHWVSHTPYICDTLYDILHWFPEYKQHITTILLNIVNYVDYQDIDDLVLPMFSLSRASDPTAFRLFEKILKSRKLTDKWIDKNKWIFDDMSKLLAMKDCELKTLQLLSSAVYMIPKWNSDIEILGNIQNTMKHGLWNSECRTRILKLVLSPDMAVSECAQAVMENITRYATKKMNFTFNFKPEEIFYLQSCFLYVEKNWKLAFAIKLLHPLRLYVNAFFNDKIISVLTSTLALRPRTTAQVTIYNAMVTFFSNFNYDKNQYYHTFTIMKSYKEFFQYSYFVRGDETLDFLERIYALAQDIDITGPHFDTIRNQIEECKKNAAIENRLEQNGVSIEYPNEFKCPITQDIMKEPVVASDGHSYEKSALMSFLLKGNGKSPLTREKLKTHIIISNINLKKRIREYAEDICEVVEKKSKNEDKNCSSI